jgi:ribonucleoside-diphosphate reductase alpha chain
MSERLPTFYQEFIHYSRYSRWLYTENRRETWEETVARYFDFFENHLKEKFAYNISKKLRGELEDAVLNLDVMPSMRALMTAGSALERDNICAYNCSYIAVDNIRAFDEILYILMNGTGVGFSVERQYVCKLPDVPDELYDTDTTIIVSDSKLGWAKALKELISMLYVGQIPKWDLTRIREAGVALKTFGGRASGPEPLNDLFKFVVRTFKDATGRKLQSLECHDIVCKIAEIVLVGGVRRSATISLSNLSDDRMRNAKTGQWWIDNPQRSLANNSACYTEKPDVGVFIDEWKALYTSKSGERGIFNRKAAKRQAERTERRDSNHEFGTNPCGEIILRNNAFCNLSEVVIRDNDSKEDILNKIRLATILGTFQSTLTEFRYIRKTWQNNCEEERLLGVSLTGIMDNKFTSELSDELKDFLCQAKECAINTNHSLANKLGINPSASITCVKPSGTVSQLVDSSSGIHARHSKYYIRSVRADNKDPLCEFLKDQGVPNEADCMSPDNVTVFYFPIESPDDSVFRNELTATEQLDFWLFYKTYWTEHNPSVTISVKEEEWFNVAAFVYENFNEISGVSFLPYSEHVYQQAPYQECTKEEYEEAKRKMPDNIDWEKLTKYESSDLTAGAQELACSSGSCDIVDLIKKK